MSGSSKDGKKKNRFKLKNWLKNVSFNKSFDQSIRKDNNNQNDEDSNDDLEDINKNLALNEKKNMKSHGFDTLLKHQFNRIKIKSNRKIIFILLLLGIDLIIRVVFESFENLYIFPAIRIFIFFFTYLYFWILCLKVLRNHYNRLKFFYTMVIISYHILRILEILHGIINYHSNPVSNQILIDFLLNFMIETLAFNSLGIFSFKTYLVIYTPLLIFFLVLAGFQYDKGMNYYYWVIGSYIQIYILGFIQSYCYIKTVLSDYTKYLLVERQNLKIKNFVDRLTPLNVIFILILLGPR